VLQAQTQRREADDTPGAALAALAGLLDGGMAAPLVVALRDGGDPLGEEAFEHGLRVLIDGTAAALERHREDGR
jgi:TetR/AcrR family tetracycline transcriptional repressor